MAKKKKIERSSVCLVMIVKNESKVIEKCLASVKDYINYWVICDTGSTDGTQDLIKSTMKSYGIEGELHQSEWIDYGTNRTESLKLSEGKCDYRLIIDADDVLVVEDSENLFKNLINDSYKIQITLGEISYLRTQLIKSNQDWKYIGVLHEYLEGPAEAELSEGVIEEAYMVASISGDKRGEEGINGKNKYHNDALIFEKELVSNKDLDEGLKARYQFYLAQSYRDAGMLDRSIEEYKKRVALGGWEEEVYISLYMIAKIMHSMEKPDLEIIDAYMQAWEFRPVRLEAPYCLIRFLALRKRYFYAFSIANMCMRMQPCNDILFVESDIWKWKMTDEYSVLAYYTGNVREAYTAAKSIMELPDFGSFTEKEKERINKNFEAFKKIYEPYLTPKPAATNIDPAI
jgi:glycosyltransferase involved in cell wall biosynthesis